MRLCRYFKLKSATPFQRSCIQSQSAQVESDSESLPSNQRLILKLTSSRDVPAGAISSTRISPLQNPFRSHQTAIVLVPACPAASVPASSLHVATRLKKRDNAPRRFPAPWSGRTQTNPFPRKNESAWVSPFFLESSRHPQRSRVGLRRELLRYSGIVSIYAWENAVQ